MASQIAEPLLVSHRNNRSDFILLWGLRFSALAAAIIVVLIFTSLILESLPILQKIGILPFFTDPSWHPTSELYNLTPMLWGTLFAVAGSVIITTPIGILSATFCHFYAPKPIATAYRRMIELLAGIPSVVYGFWGLVVLVPLIASFEPPGASLLAGIIILSMMTLPTIALMADASIEKVPDSYKKAAVALGLSRWATIRKVIFPAAKAGMFTGTILQTARALGETMAVLMVTGNVVETPDSIFAPIRALTSNIALEMAYATGDHRSALFVSGLVLMAMVVALVAAVEVINREKKHD